MKKPSQKFLKWTSLIVFVAVCVIAADSSAEVGRITKEELKGMMDSPDVIVVDVRAGHDWKASDQKIRGAVRLNPGSFDTWSDTFSKDKTLVLYCA